MCIDITHSAVILAATTPLPLWRGATRWARGHNQLQNVLIDKLSTSRDTLTNTHQHFTE